MYKRYVHYIYNSIYNLNHKFTYGLMVVSFHDKLVHSGSSLTNVNFVYLFD